MTVLIVDDEPSVRNVLIRTVGSAGHHVLEAASGAEAAQLARSFHGPIHLAVIDQTLEDRRKGMDVAAEIAATRPGIRLLLISGHLEGEVMASAPRAEFTLDYLQKPFSPQVLLDKIERMMGRNEGHWHA